MARYVLLEFDDNSDADNFVKAVALHRESEGSRVLYAKEHSNHPGMFSVVGPTYDIGVVGIFFKPTQFCECPSPGDRQARGQKWNLYIHRDCGKPIRGHTQHPRNLLIDEGKWAKLTPREKAAFYLGIQEGIPLPWLGRDA